MKVHGSNGTIIQQTNTVGKEKITQGSDFQKIMDEMNANVENAGAKEVQKKLPPLFDGIQIIRGIEKTDENLSSYDKQKIVSDLQNTLDLVDFYSKKLADTSMSVADLDSLVNHLEEKVNTLRGLGDSVDTPDKVKPVISDMVITIGTEIAKYRRGDYA